LHRTRDPQGVAERISLAPQPASKGELLPDFVAAIGADRDLGAETQALFDSLSAVFACDAARKARTWKDIVYP
jgi:hypothetical protein